MRRLLAATVAVLWVAAATAAPAAGQPPEGGARLAKHVVVVDWDGFDAAFLGRAETPNLDALAARGSLTIGSSTRVPVGADTGATVRVTAVNRAFLLDDSDLPQASFASWTGTAVLTSTTPTATLWSR